MKPQRVHFLLSGRTNIHDEKKGGTPSVDELVKKITEKSW